MQFRKKNLVFLIITIIITLIVIEFSLQGLSLLFPRIGALLLRLPRIPIMIEDERLETRPNPEYPGHDRKGFRNKHVPEEISIVALGDSQTYGMGVAAHQAWPQQLEKISKTKTYNMAWGGIWPSS